jgi:hypothetical protein
MKRFPLVLCAIAISISAAHAGPDRYSNKEMASPPPCPTWYADEWNVSLWGAYAFTNNDYPTLENSLLAGAVININSSSSVFHHDRYLDADHAWGGGIDAKYFFKRYFGIGIEGFALNVQQSYPDVFIDFGNVGAGTNFARTSHARQAVGSVLATFTLRYPIGCSRFAPYVFAGGGAIFGGGQLSLFDTTSRGDIEFTSRSGAVTKAIGQVGGGIEIRLTPHIGLTNDFSWNVVDGRNNNFGMVRTGINFAF